MQPPPPPAPPIGISHNVPPPPNDFATGSAPYAGDMIDASREKPYRRHTHTHTRICYKRTHTLTGPATSASSPPDTLIQSHFQAAGRRKDTRIIITAELLTDTKFASPAVFYFFLYI